MTWSQVKNDLSKTMRDSIDWASNFPVVKRWRERHPRLTAFAKRRLSPKDFTGLPLTLLAAAFLYAIVLFLGLAEDYLAHDPLILVDVRIANLLFFFRSDALLRFSYFVTLFAEAGIVIVIGLGLSALFWFRRRRVYILTLWLSLITAEGTAFLGKLLFHRARPDELLRAVSEETFSFPSGHATGAAALYGFIAYLIIRSSKSLKTWVITLISFALLVLLVDFSRLYLGVHYLSDVLAGNLVGLAGLLFAIGVTEWIVSRKHLERQPRLSLVDLGLIAAGALLVVSLFFFKTAPLSLAHRPAAPPKNIGNEDVLSLFQDGMLPRYTETLTGGKQEPTNLIIIASEKCFESQIASAGWSLAESVSPASTKRLAKAALLNKGYPTAPMTPSFYNAFPNDYGFEKETDRKTVRSRHHARFWRTGYATSNGNLHVGTASLDTGLKWGITHAIAPDIDTERDIFIADLEKAGIVMEKRLTPFVPPTLGQNFASDPFFTNGEAAILTFQACP